MSVWHYAQNEKPCGPVDTAVLQELFRSRAGYSPLPADTLVWKEGMANWAPANTIPELAAMFSASSAPPPLPGPQSGVPPLSDFAPPRNPPPLISSASASAADPARADIEQNKVFAVLAYLGILFLVPLLAAPNSPYARYHTNQGIVLFITALIVHFASIMLAIFTFGLGFLVWPAAWVLIIVFVILGIVNAASGQCKPLPLIGHFQLMK
jgi:uncharacterized membrane protein